jgi:hypothetical protein
MASNPHDPLFRKTFGVAENAAASCRRCCRAVRVGFDAGLLEQWIALLEQAAANAGPEAFAQAIIHESAQAMGRAGASARA